MAKRPAEEDISEINALKGRERPVKQGNGAEVDFEDEFEDEFESEDEIFEAGADGQPDEEKDLDGPRGMWNTPEALCDCPPWIPRKD